MMHSLHRPKSHGVAGKPKNGVAWHVAGNDALLTRHRIMQGVAAKQAARLLCVRSPVYTQ